MSIKKEYATARRRIAKLTKDPEERRILWILVKRYLDDDGK